MKNGQIFAHKSTARGRLDLEYLDEVSSRKVSLRKRGGMEAEIGRKLKHFTDYASKEMLGQVHAGGFLHHHIRINPDGSNTAPSQLSNEERKRRITDSWLQHLSRFPSTAKRPVIAHRLVFSMSKAQHDALVSAGINPDQVLHATMKKVMRKFAEKFHAGDSIGYAYGIHHDTANPHIHVALCPRTAKGRYVGCSTSRFSRSKHQKQMDLIKSWFKQENEHWGKALRSPQQIQQRFSKRLDADQWIFSPRLTPLQINALRCVQNHEALRLQQLHSGIRHLETTLALQRQMLAAQHHARFLGRLIGTRTPKTLRLAAKLNNVAQRESLRELRERLFRLKRQYRTLHKRYTQLYGNPAYGHRNTQHQNTAIRQSPTHGSHPL
jgi:hypothetical protein